jgi:hypothetical protein
VHPGLFLCCSPQGRAACPESGCKLGVSQMYGSHNKIHFRVFASVPHKLKNKEPNYITHSLHGCTHSLFLFTLLLYSSFTPPLFLLYSSITPLLLLLYSSLIPPLLLHYSSFTPPLLLHHSSFTPPLLLHYSSFTPPLLLLYSSITPPLLLLYTSGSAPKCWCELSPTAVVFICESTCVLLQAPLHC